MSKIHFLHRNQKYERRDPHRHIPWQSEDPSVMSGWERAAWAILAGMVLGWLVLG